MSEIKLEPDKIYLVLHVIDYKGNKIYAPFELARSYRVNDSWISLELFGTDEIVPVHEYEIIREIVVPELSGDAMQDQEYLYG